VSENRCSWGFISDPTKKLTALPRPLDEFRGKTHKNGIRKEKRKGMIERGKSKEKRNEKTCSKGSRGIYAPAIH